jgi:hypothetical protein
LRLTFFYFFEDDMGAPSSEFLETLTYESGGYKRANRR